MNSLMLLLALPLSSTPDVSGRMVEYQLSDNKTTFQGYLVGDMNGKPKPGVLLVHAWGGLTDYEKGRAQEIAKSGYTVFCADIYGKGIRPTTTEEKGKLAGMYKGDRGMYREHLKVALEEMKRWPMTDKEQVAVIGYCFGGTGALELARSGAELKGAVSFHGGLDNPNPSDAKNITCPVLILHGADDPFVPQAQVDAFKSEMKAADKPFEFIAYPGAVHSFTEKAAGNDNSKGAAYNENADKKSFAEMLKFFKRIFR